jgi:CRISPR type III-A-associated protein Csm2
MNDNQNNKSFLNKEYFTNFFDESGDPTSYILKKRDSREEIKDFLEKTKDFITYKDSKKIKKRDFKKKDEYEYVKNKVTTTQLRNIFSLIQKSSKKEVTDVMLSDLEMQRVKLAYIAGRTEEISMQQLCALLDALIQKLDNTNYSRFRDFFEALIAYDKYAEKIK